MLAVSGRTLQYARTQEANLGGQNVLLPVGCSPSCTPPVAVQHQRLHFCGEVCWPSQQQTFEARWHDGHSFRGHNSLPLVGLAAQPTPPSLRMAALQQMIDLCALTPSGRPRQLGQLGRQLGGAASVALSWFKNHTPSGSSRHSVLRCLSLARSLPPSSARRQQTWGQSWHCECYCSRWHWVRPRALLDGPDRSLREPMLQADVANCAELSDGFNGC